MIRRQFGVRVVSTKYVDDGATVLVEIDPTLVTNSRAAAMSAAVEHAASIGSPNHVQIVRSSHAGDELELFEVRVERAEGV